MKQKELAKKIILLGLLLSLFLIAACSGYGRMDACTGSHCKYYTGTQGVESHLERPPNALYYRSGDLGTQDGNMVEFNVRIQNRGASDALGAVFISGFSPNNFDIWRIDSLGKRRVDIPKTYQGCYFDIFGIEELEDATTWNFMANCFGAGVSRYGDRTNLNVNFGTLGQYIGNIGIEGDFGDTIRSFGNWMSEAFINNMDLTFRDGEGLSQLSIGTNFGFLNFGRTLMLLVASLDFESFGGASFYLAGNNQETPGGETDYKTFQVQMITPWPAGQDYYYQKYQLKTCYAYTTFISPQICVDPDPFSPERKVCNDFSEKVDPSQGAPVAVTNIRTENTGGEVFIEMTIKNVGRGEVWDVGYLEYCSPYYPATTRDQMKNVVYVGYAVLENQILDCGNTYRLRLDPHTNEATLRCRYDLQGSGYVGSAYQSPLKMELWYGYEEHIPTSPVAIRRIN